MSKYRKQVIGLASAVLLMTACYGTASQSLETSPTVLIQDPSTSAPAAQLPTLTTMPPTPNSPSPAETLPAAGESEMDPTQDNLNKMEANRMDIQIQDQVLTATLADNSSAAALKEALSQGPITINMRDYGSMEKVGSLGRELPRNDEQITTEPGDIILYQGSALVIYYAPNSWNFTRLGKVNDLSAAELKEILGDGNVTITLSLPQK